MAAAANPFAKPTEIYGFQTLHREIGYYITRLEQYENSLKFYDEAIKKTPDDKRALIGRARARTKVIQYQGALEDVNKALSYNPDDLVLLADKALNTYLCCEFEEGLLQNTRLLPKRQKPENFMMGKMQCADAIENCLGERAGRPLRDYFKIIRKLAWKKNYAAQKPFEPVPTLKPKKPKKFMLSKLVEIGEGQKEPVQPKKFRTRRESGPEIKQLHIRESLHSAKPDDEPIPIYNKPFPFRPMQSYTSNIENYVAEKYLDSMYQDKIFLKKLQTEPGAISPNQEGSRKIQQIAKNCLKTVSYKQEILRTRRPFYFIKYQEARVSGELKERQKMELEVQQRQTKQEGGNLLKKLREAYDNKELRLVLEYVEKLKRFCDSKPKKLLLDKDHYLQEIYLKVCCAFYEMYRVNPEHHIFQQNRRIYCILGLALSREPSADSVVDQFKNVFLDYQKKIWEFSQRLEYATCADEVCWYYHELSRYEYEIKHYELSRLYAKKCMRESKSLANKDLGKKWIFNSWMLMVKNNTAEHNKNDAKSDLQCAMKCVTDLRDDDKIDFIEKCQTVVESLEFDDIFGEKQLERREKKIIQMMASSKMKDEVAHLFRQMAALPTSRRMTVMPGISVEKSTKKPGKGGRMSIMPTKDGSTSGLSKTEDIKDLINYV